MSIKASGFDSSCTSTTVNETAILPQVEVSSLGLRVSEKGILGDPKGLRVHGSKKDFGGKLSVTTL